MANKFNLNKLFSEKEMENGVKNEPYQLTFDEIRDATGKINKSIIHTPLCEAKMSKFMDYDIYLKCENLQYTGSCTERGICNIIETKHEQLTTRGMIVPSNGNMALAAAYHAGLYNIPVTVVLPNKTSPAQAERCSELGAEVIICGDHLDETRQYAIKASVESGQILINKDEPLMMAGLGTVGLEIVSQLPEVDAVIVPVGSGALLAGVLVACKKLKSSCLVYGAECSKVPKMMKALQDGKPATVPVVPNLAEGMNTPIVGNNAFKTICGRVDRMLVVDETFIARAVINLLERERLVADGAGVCAIAAVLQGLVPELRGKRTVCIIGDGNVESGRLARTIQRGLGAFNRLLRFSVPIPDQGDGLEVLARTISEENAVLKSLVTEQMWISNDVSSTLANVVLETANEVHATNVKDRLRDLYPSARFAIHEDYRQTLAR